METNYFAGTNNNNAEFVKNEFCFLFLSFKVGQSYYGSRIKWFLFSMGAPY